MSLLIPLLIATITVRLGAPWLVQRGMLAAQRWASWSAAAGAGMAVVYVCTAITHFVEPQRSGLIAIVPSLVPAPALVVTLSGIAEIALAIALVTPRVRRWAALASMVFLILVFPANVVAAGGVDHAAAPTTPLILRAALQLAFIVFSLAAFLQERKRIRPPRHREKDDVLLKP